jgi:hypothetical protein
MEDKDGKITNFFYKTKEVIITRTIITMGLCRRCVSNCKQWHFLIDGGGLDFWFRTTKRQWSYAIMSPKVRTLVLKWWITKTTIFLDEQKVNKTNWGEG